MAVLEAAKWAAGRLLRLVPEPILGRILPGGFRYSMKDRPSPPVAPSASIRLYIAPVNYAGQGWHWARAVERHVDDAGAVNMVVRTGRDFRHPADHVVPLGVYAASRSWQRAHRRAVLSGFSHVLIEAEKQPFGAVLDETVPSQVRELDRAGVSVLMLCHGSDIRSPSRHIARYPDSPFLDSMAGIAPRLERIAQRNRRLLDELARPVFVSTPDLLADVPEARWLPTIVDPAQWASASVPLERARPIVAHAPSSAPTKGSDLIDPVLRRLDAEGLVEYRRIERVPFERMPEVYRDADIVLDQFRLGDYGVAACEAMAAGRVVVAHVSEVVREHVRSETGLDLPIVEASADTLEAVLRSLVASPDEAQATAAAGEAFVRAVHDGRRSAEVLRPFLES